MCIRDRLIGEEPLIFVSEQVWSRIFLFLFAQTTLTAVAGNIAAAVGEFVDGQTAVVGTSVTFGHGSGILQFFHLLFGEHGGFLTFVTLSCDQGSTECTHDAGNIRTVSYTHLNKMFRENGLEFVELFQSDTFVYLWSGHPLAGQQVISMEELDEYPCLSFDQGKNNSLYLAEEMKSTYDYRRLIKANDRATLLNLMRGLNAYTLCSGIICEMCIRDRPSII